DEVPLGDELGNDERARPEAVVPIGEARQRPTLVQRAEGREESMALLTGMASVPGPGEQSGPRSWSDTPERAGQCVRTTPESVGPRRTSTAGTGGPTRYL
ncbi:hypothetical protein JG687_00015594, partial [Phytophthora cactorum]